MIGKFLTIQCRLDPDGRRARPDNPMAVTATTIAMTTERTMSSTASGHLLTHSLRREVK